LDLKRIGYHFIDRAGSRIWAFFQWLESADLKFFGEFWKFAAGMIFSIGGVKIWTK